MIEDLISLIESPNKEKCYSLWSFFKLNCIEAKGSSHNHQSWDGGYFDHIYDIMNYSTILYKSLNKINKLPFKLSDALLVLFLHDIEKPLKYSNKFKNNCFNKTNEEIRNSLLNEYSFLLTEKNRIESPWLVTQDISDITKPKDATKRAFETGSRN